MKLRFAIAAALSMSALQGMAFCGFFVAKAGANLYNKNSQVILVRDGERTVVTMSNDFHGDVRDFAMVVPVPVVLGERDIRVVNDYLFQRLDGHTAPRMAEYYDQNPCAPAYVFETVANASMVQKSVALADMQEEATRDNVRIEAQYQIGEYDILILSATESTGLKTWLERNGYSIPAQAEEVLDPYIRNNLKFFVVKVNLDKQKTLGFQNLRPIQIEYSDPKFMLPIRLGMANAEDMQDLTIYALTRSGRVECTNYRTVPMPTDREVPEFVEERFDKFYVDLFNKEYHRANQSGVFLEYSWDVSTYAPVKCDPCPTPPIMDNEYTEAGVNWLQSNQWGQGGPLFITRLHVRYDREHFPQDLRFQITPNTERFQCRYVVRHPAQGDFTCEDGKDYLEMLVDRRQRELQELAALTGWDVSGYSNYWAQYAKQLKVHFGPKEAPKKDHSDNDQGSLLPASPDDPTRDDSGFGDESAAIGTVGMEFESASTSVIAESGIETSSTRKWVVLVIVIIGIQTLLFVINKSAQPKPSRQPKRLIG